MSKFQKTKFAGVYFIESQTRKHGVRFDRCFYIRHRVTEIQSDGQAVTKVKDERIGWWSEGKKAEDGAMRLEELARNKREGTGPATLQGIRRENEGRREAEAAALKAETEANRTLSEYWQESYFPAAQRSKKQCSWEKEGTHFTKWIGPLLGGLSLRSIGISQWDELVKTLSAAGLSPRSKEYITGTFRRILKHAYDRRMVDEAPPSGKRVGVSGPGNNRRLRVISHDEETAIMQHLATLDMCAWRITRFCFLTGCRASEAFSLTWANLDFASNVLIYPETKNHDSRTLPLTPPLLELFSGMTPGASSDRVFCKLDGSAYYQAPRAFKTVVKQLGSNDGRSKRDLLVFHSIRHTVATRLAQRLGPRDLMDVMGWRTVQMAVRYIHANQEAKMRALSMLGVAPAANVLPFVRTAENQ